MKRCLGLLSSLAAPRCASLVLCLCRPSSALRLAIRENLSSAFGNTNAQDITHFCPSEYGKEISLPKMSSDIPDTFNDFPAEEERDARSPHPICSQAKQMLFCLSISFSQLPWFITYILGPTPETCFVEYPVQLEPGLSRRCLARGNEIMTIMTFNFVCDCGQIAKDIAETYALRTRHALHCNFFKVRFKEIFFKIAVKKGKLCVM